MAIHSSSSFFCFSRKYHSKRFNQDRGSSLPS
uniref:Uncharacterized protein n=1 Tax=Arundo donax TaxID=35708 RepID=A0A0A8YSU0_ARUDO